LGADAEEPRRPRDRGPIARSRVGARHRCRQPNELRDAAPRSRLVAPQAVPLGADRGRCGIEGALDALVLATVEPEPAECLQHPLLDASEPRGGLAARRQGPPDKRLALGAKPPDVGQLLQETAPLSEILVPRAVTLLVGLVPDEVAEPDLARAQLVGEPDHVGERVRCAEQRPDERSFALLDPLRDLDLALTGEQCDRTRFAQIDTDRVDA